VKNFSLMAPAATYLDSGNYKFESSDGSASNATAAPLDRANVEVVQSCDQADFFSGIE